MKQRRLFHRILFFLFWSISAFAQGSPQFDAATVKLLPSGFSTAMEGGPGTHDAGRVTWQRAWLLQLLAKAFHVDNLGDITGPDWIGGNGRPVYAFTAT